MCVSDRPEKPVITAAWIFSNKTRLHWRVPHNNNAPVTGYHLMYLQRDTGNYMEFETTNDTFVVTNLLPGVTYVFTVVAINEIGESATSDAFSVTTLEEGKEFTLLFQSHIIVVLSRKFLQVHHRM